MLSSCGSHACLPNTGSGGNRCVPLLQVKDHWAGIGLLGMPPDEAHLSLVGTILHTRRNCTWNKLLWRLDSKGRQETVAGPHSLLTTLLPVSKGEFAPPLRPHSSPEQNPGMAATAATTGGPTNVLRLGCQRQRLHGHEKGRHLYTCMGVPGDGHEAQLGTKASAPFAPGLICCLVE